MTTRKPAQATDNGHLLAAVRDLWRDGFLPGDRVRALGAEYGLQDCIDFTADSAAVGESSIVGLVQAAGRSSGSCSATAVEQPTLAADALALVVLL